MNYYHENIFTFVNPKRKPLLKTHIYREEILDRIVVGQRLGELMRSDIGQQVLAEPLIENLAELIGSSECMDDSAKARYLINSTLREQRFVLSTLREAPALGAGIDAFLLWKRRSA